LSLKAWPYPGKIGIVERHRDNDKTEMHVFEHGVHVMTLKGVTDLDEIASIKSELIFDLDKLLVKELSKPRVKSRR